jgi:hypothetical protein
MTTKIGTRALALVALMAGMMPAAARTGTWS